MTPKRKNQRQEAILKAAAICFIVVAILLIGLGVSVKAKNKDSEKKSIIAQTTPNTPTTSTEPKPDANEVDNLAMLIYCEAGDQAEYQAKLAVGAVVVNRKEDLGKDFRNTVNEVIFQPSQFESVYDSKFHLYGRIIEKSEVDPQIYAECLKAAKEAMQGNDPTAQIGGGGALYYFDIKDGYLDVYPSIQLGDLVFFKDWPF